MPELLIYDDIGMGGITAKDFIEQLDAIGDVPELTVRINSDGGEVNQGVAIYNALKRHPAKVTTIVDGGAASIAAYIAMAGDVREMAENGLMMTHGARCGTEGTEEDHEQNIEMLRSANRAMTGTYAELLQRSEEETAVMLKRDKWMDAKTALSEGFITRIGPANTLVAQYESKYVVPSALAAQIKVNDPIQEAPVSTPIEGPKAATPKQLKAACPKASAEFLFAQAEQESTVEEAQAAYLRSMEEELDAVKARLSAMEEESAVATAKAMEEEEVAKAKAMEEEEAKAKAAARTGVKPIANSTGPTGTGLPAHVQWQQAIQEHVKAGHARAKAIRLANKANPGLRSRVVEEANA